MSRLLLPNNNLKSVNPVICTGCIWGNWDGFKQFCSFADPKEQPNN